MSESQRPGPNKLILMRHAKSDWNDARLSDKARPLNERGRAAAPAMARWLASQEYYPHLVLCSSAVRTQQTLELMQREWKLLSPTIPACQVEMDDDLYLASAEMILEIASKGCRASECEHCLVIGHNPGMEQLVSLLSGVSIEMPTAAVAVFDSVDRMWPEQWGRSQAWKLRDMVKPRELEKRTL
jgi:phosphohistidine phosphatase